MVRTTRLPRVLKSVLIAVLVALLPAISSAAGVDTGWIDLTQHRTGYTALILFTLAYLLVMSEEFTHLRKSKPVILAAGAIWGLIAWQYHTQGLTHAAEVAFRSTLLEFSELFLFLLAAMTYVNAMDERQVFEALRSWLIRKGCSYRLLFWITGILSFFLSPLIDNLTTALVMCAVVLAVGKGNDRFVGLASINIVVAANAGGAFSPFGDLTTLMVWQKGLVDFQTFFLLFIPSVINFVVPAILMNFFVPQSTPAADGEAVQLRRGALTILFLFGCTIVTAVSFHSFLHLPPMLGMMTGLGYLQIFGYYLKMTHPRPVNNRFQTGVVGDVVPLEIEEDRPFDIFSRLARAEWDTLLFFYGVVLCVGGLGFIGYLAMASQVMYVDLGATTANILVGILSAIVDNIPVMYAVLSMNPEMPLGQWLLVTLTAGVGGSLLSIGSAAGVALMGQARGKYTFFTHLKWTPVIALGYAASILVHLWINADTF
ncbi:MAG: sodium:proton antiporter NhaD [Gammaproteobacteria bacterium]|nr:MAG: sodium:proton antiporter NhaD [Gammaproteobacteria bacterium]